MDGWIEKIYEKIGMFGQIKNRWMDGLKKYMKKIYGWLEGWIKKNYIYGQLEG